jgi:competence protein ComEC
MKDFMTRQSVHSRAKPIKFAVRKKKFFGLVLIGMVMIFALAWQANYVGWFNRELKVWIFDVGQGDAIFIETPAGQQILVDAGADGTILTKLGQVMLPWDRSIDAVVVTHPHADHEGGLLEILSRYEVGIIYETGVLGVSDLQNSAVELAAAQGTEILLVDEGEEVDGEDEVSLKVLAPDESWTNKKADNLNTTSIVLLLTYGETLILLTGDAPINEENEILDDIFESVDVLKVAHHGSVTSTSGSFLEAVAPRYAVISVGEGNDYGHPHPATLERLRSRGISAFRTDLDGDILITSSGGEPVVESRPLPF